MPSIEINGIEYHATISKEGWGHGVCVLINITNGEEHYFSAKVTSSESASENYGMVSNLSSEELFKGAWQQFKEHYPFDKLKELAETGIVVLIPWR